MGNLAPVFTILVASHGIIFRHLLPCCPTGKVKFRARWLRLSGGSAAEAMSNYEGQDERERSDEIEALQAIFSDDFRQIDSESIEIQVDKDLSIRICLPKNYPSTCPPLFELHSALLSDEQVYMLMPSNVIRAHSIMLTTPFPFVFDDTFR